METENKDLIETFNCLAKDEKLNKMIIPEGNKLTLSDIKNFINILYKKYESYNDARRDFIWFTYDLENVTTIKFDQIEKERLEYFKNLIKHTKQIYNSIVKRPIPYLMMILLREDFRFFETEMELTEHEISYLNNNEIYQCARLAEDYTIIHRYDNHQFKDDYTFFLEKLNENLKEAFESVENRIKNFGG